jgi:hypothetical protein
VIEDISLISPPTCAASMAPGMPGAPQQQEEPAVCTQGIARQKSVQTSSDLMRGESLRRRAQI